MSRSCNRFPRITSDPAVMEGTQCIHSMRVTVGIILGELGGSATIDKLIADYPYLEREDDLEAPRLASSLASFREIELANAI